MQKWICSCRTKTDNPNRLNPKAIKRCCRNAAKRRCHHAVWLRVPLALLSMLAVLFNHAANASDGKTPICQSTATHSKAKAKVRHLSAKGATVAKEAKAEAIARKMDGQVPKAFLGKIRALISPKFNFVARIDEMCTPNKITFYRTSDGKAVSSLRLEKELGEFYNICWVYVSDDERFVNVYGNNAHRSDYVRCIYKRVRPFVYRYLKTSYDSGMSMAEP